MNERHIWYAER